MLEPLLYRRKLKILSEAHKTLYMGFFFFKYFVPLLCVIHLKKFPPQWISAATTASEFQQQPLQLKKFKKPLTGLLADENCDK